MTIDKQKLQKLLWAEAASYRADCAYCADWKRNTEALQEFLGEKTVEEVALELLAENDRLNAENKQLILLECHGGTAEAAINLLDERGQLKAENETLREDAERYRRMRAAALKQADVLANEFDAEFDIQLGAALGKAVQP